MKVFVGFDLETVDSFSKKTHDKHLGELGAVKYVYENGKFSPIEIFNHLINEGVEVDPEAEKYTGISNDMVKTHGKPLDETLDKFNNFLEGTDFIVSHNGDAFDVPVMIEAYKRAHLENKLKMNIDTMLCIEYPSNCKSLNLTYLQAFHGFVNPFPHRAFADAMAMMKILGMYNVEDVIEVAKSPSVKYVAKFSYPNERKFPTRSAYLQAMDKFNSVKDTVKSLGFRWDAENKQWIYEGKELIYKRRVEPNLPCATEKIEGEKDATRTNQNVF